MKRLKRPFKEKDNILTNRELFQRHLAQTSDFPLSLEIDRAQGVFLFGKDNKRYIDLISGIGVSNVGHCHPKVVKAIQEQAAKYLHLMVYGEYIQSPQVQLAKAICETLPAPLDNVYLLNSGSEAVEGAIKLAKRYTNKPEVLSCCDAYHGSSHGALSASGDESFKQNFRPLVPGFRTIRFGEVEDLSLINDRTAAVILETVQGEAGVRYADKKYFKALRTKCNETGTLVILDEIQCGFGRTGSFWAFEQYDIVPDILVSAKGMGGGMPISCFVSSSKIMGVLKNDPILGHISTFGGHPVSSAAALATVRIIQEEKLIEGVAEKEACFRSLLTHDKIVATRSRGLMMAFEFESFEVVKPIIDKAIEMGVITDWFLFNDRSMRVAPPLTISYQEIEEACQILKKAMDS